MSPSSHAIELTTGNNQDQDNRTPAREEMVKADAIIVSKQRGWKSYFDGLLETWRNFDSNRRDRILGIFFILCVAVIWVAASFLVKDLEGAGGSSSSKEEKQEAVHPIMITFVANALFVVYLPITWVKKLWSKSTNDKKQNESLEGGAGPSTESEPAQEEESDPLIVQQLNSSRDYIEPGKRSGLSLFTTAAIIAPFWWLAQFTFNVSLTLTSVSSNTILSSTSSLFTFLLSLWVLREPFMVHKLFSLFTCMAGMAIVALVDNSGDNEGSSRVLGDILTLVSAGLYAIYTVSLKKLLPTDRDVDMTLFFGYMGLLLSVSVGCLVLFLHCVGSVNAALSGEALGWTVLKGLFDNVLSDYLWARAVLLIGPTIATVGLFMQVPMAVVVDLIYSHPKWMDSIKNSVWMIVGVFSILGGFLGLNCDSPLSDCCGAAKTKQHVVGEMESGAL